MKLIKHVVFRVLIVLVLSGIFITGCGVYSFTGISIDYTQIQTISISNFPDESASDPQSIGGPSNMSQLFSEKLRDYFQRNTQLRLVPSNGDLHIDGEIKSYRNNPQAITSADREGQGDEAGLMRLTISIRVNYENTIDETVNFDKEFSFFGDYDPRQTTLPAEEPRLIDLIFEQIVFDIFNQSVATW